MAAKVGISKLFKSARIIIYPAPLHICPISDAGFDLLWGMVPPDFLLKLSAFIREKKLFEKDAVLLCAVSGGLDSMVMAEALKQLGFRLEIAHVNFGLRGIDSDLDEAFVRNWAVRNQFPFHLKKAMGSLENLSGSLQEKARHFRYQWLESLVAERKINHLLLAHHADDLAETILMQFFRGAGIQGLTALRASSGIRRRPLLAFSKSELEAFARQQGLLWREDASNAGDAYLRNRMRHKLLPVLSALFPGFEKVIRRNSDRLRISGEALDFLFEHLFSSFFLEINQFRSVFKLDEISRHSQGRYFVSELLLRNGFSFSDAEHLSEDLMNPEARSGESAAGLRVELCHPRLLLWQQRPPVMQAIRMEVPIELKTTLPDGCIFQLRLESNLLPARNLHEWKAPLQALSFPMCMRPWQAGDRMAVKGMGGKRKKLSDVFSEAGLSPTEKALQVVLEDASGKIHWIPGLRNSEPAFFEYQEGPFASFSVKVPVS